MEQISLESYQQRVSRNKPICDRLRTKAKEAGERADRVEEEITQKQERLPFVQEEEDECSRALKNIEKERDQHDRDFELFCESYVQHSEGEDEYWEDEDRVREYQDRYWEFRDRWWELYNRWEEQASQLNDIRHIRSRLEVDLHWLEIELRDLSDLIHDNEVRIQAYNDSEVPRVELASDE